MENRDFDVVIIGGSYAGLSAAMALGRAIRKVLIIDAGKPCNRQTPHSHNFITHDGAKPAEISALAKAQVLAYPTVRFENDTVVDVTGANNDFTIVTEQKGAFTAKKIIFATGVSDIMPAIPGFSESWGISVIHCPYCHGYEYSGQNTGIFMNGEGALEFVKLIDNWTQKLTLFTNGKAAFNKEMFSKISNPDFRIVEKEIKELLHDRGHLSEVVFKDGSREELDAMYAKLPFQQHTDIPARIGCEINDAGYIKVDEFGKTSVAGIFAAGDNTLRLRSVSSAVATGTVAGAFLNHEMISDRYV
ncbi:NAD(P)/FAD-dependent oxidoreductase [Dyadobacter sp. LHD-138]|uniref:NAD(P)/FAD-dependent oxidoreductase n=1 Tax=Dyadobacter sp. LHD-138 TaxID=3071413 RepID=UPI0027E17264|nr:NAD(P)/FAD-dependent oxidoreductase [Dyadobacter sp. LHD-138]MDQ6481402.1 NAD(P)/FAD-dependent oxidoreductase [Dyadobacter sp. LHD-138]